jgi:adenosylcobinamide-GDP ribazoletransferase
MVAGLPGGVTRRVGRGVALVAVLTGALLADTADGFGGRTTEDRLRMVRDHAVGAYGVVALILAILAEAAAGAAVAGRGDAVAMWSAAGALSRSVSPALAAVLPYAQRSNSSGSVLHGDHALAQVTGVPVVRVDAPAASPRPYF